MRIFINVFGGNWDGTVNFQINWIINEGGKSYQYPTNWGITFEFDVFSLVYMWSNINFSFFFSYFDATWRGFLMSIEQFTKCSIQSFFLILNYKKNQKKCLNGNIKVLEFIVVYYNEFYVIQMGCSDSAEILHTYSLW